MHSISLIDINLDATPRSCSTGSDPRPWEKASRAKAIALNAWRNGHTGLRIAAMKVVQKIISSQTRGSPDPRVCLPSTALAFENSVRGYPKLMFLLSCVATK
jgi:hypothetical protein